MRKKLIKLFGKGKEKALEEVEAISTNNEADPIKLAPLPKRFGGSRISHVSGWIPVLLVSILVLQTMDLITLDRLGHWVDNLLISLPTQVPEETEVPPTTLNVTPVAPSVEFPNTPELIYAGDEVTLIAEIRNIDPNNIEFLVSQEGAQTSIPTSNYLPEGNNIKITLSALSAGGDIAVIAQAKDTGNQIGSSASIKIQIPYRVSAIDAKPYPNIDPQTDSLIAELQADVKIKVEKRLPDDTWIPFEGATIELTSPNVALAQVANILSDAQGEIVLRVDLAGVSAPEILFSVRLPQYGVTSESKKNIIIPIPLQSKGEFDLFKIDDPTKQVLKSVSPREWLNLYSIGDVDIDGVKYTKVLVIGGFVKGNIWGKPNHPDSSNVLSKSGAADNIIFGDDAQGLWDKQIFLVSELTNPPLEYIQVIVVGITPVK